MTPRSHPTSLYCPMKPNKADKPPSDKIKLIQKLFCGDEDGPQLTLGQEAFLNERAKLEKRLLEIHFYQKTEELKFVYEYGLMGYFFIKENRFG